MDSESTTQHGQEFRKWYGSQAELSKHTGVSVAQIKLAKKLGGIDAGFSTQGRIDYQKFSDWWKEHEQECVPALADDSLIKHKTRKERWLAEKAQLEVEKLKDRFIDKEEAKQFYTQLAASLSTVLTARFCREAPAKCVGMDAIAMELEFTRIVKEIIATLIEKPLEEWSK